MSSAVGADMLHAGSLAELQDKGCLVVHGPDRPIAVFWHDGRARAVDNRCPHMGFPLHKGTVTDGILTCHWHHARFDLASGCTFDLFADDVPTCAVELRGGEVWVAARPDLGDAVAYGRRRLQEGLAQNIALIVAKAVIGLLKADLAPDSILRDGVLYGCTYRDGWSPGLVILTAMGNIVPEVADEERFLALFQGLRHVAQDCAGQSPRRERYPLDTDDVDLVTLKRWFRYWTVVRHRDAAERTLLTAIANGASQVELADMMFCAATDRSYAAGGHALDFINKTFEALDRIGWEHAAQVLPTTVGQLVGARGGEESNAWRHPIGLVPLLEAEFGQLAAGLAAGRGHTWAGERTLAEAMLGEEPLAILAAISDAIRGGARPTQLSRALCFAGALRLARFGTANEFGDWITALHTFTYANALHQALKRLGDDVDPELLRGIYHGAVSIYLDRFLNVPPAPLPGERGLLPDVTDAGAVPQEFLDRLDTQQQVGEGARLVAAYLAGGHAFGPLFSALSRAVLREDAEFHTYQMLEASLQQYREWGDSEEGRTILVALARYLAAHSPTQRTRLQTAEIALRLHRGDRIYEED